MAGANLMLGRLEAQEKLADRLMCAPPAVNHGGDMRRAVIVAQPGWRSAVAAK